MSYTLEKLIDEYVDLQEKTVFQTEVDTTPKSLYIHAVKTQLRQDIYNEIKEEVKNDVLQESEQLMKEKEINIKLEEYKSLMFEGFFLAIFVGLFVNQMTDFIGYFKGSVSLASVWPTTIIAGIFLLVSLIIIGILFVTQGVKLTRHK